MIILKVILTTIHILLSVFLIISILLQSSKGGGLAGTFGGQASASIFGPRGAATALATFTQWLAGGFLALSLVLSLMAGASTQSESVTQKILEQSPSSQLPAVEDLDLSSPVSGTETAPEQNPEPVTQGGQ